MEGGERDRQDAKDARIREMEGGERDRQDAKIREMEGQRGRLCELPEAERER